MSEELKKLLKELKREVNNGIDSRKIDNEVGLRLLGIARDIQYELTSGSDPMLVAVRSIKNELHGIGSELHDINRSLSKRR